MGDKAHGVAHVMFADVDVAVDGTKQVDAQRAFVLAKEGFFYPIFYLLFHAWREAYMPTDSLVGKEDITPVNALGGFEERVADKMQLFTAKKVFQGEIVGHLVSGLGDNTTPEELQAWYEAVEHLHPKQIMIYVIDRKTPEENLSKIAPEKMHAIAQPLQEKGYDVIISC